MKKQVLVAMFTVVALVGFLTEAAEAKSKHHDLAYHAAHKSEKLSTAVAKKAAKKAYALVRFWI